MTAKDGSVPCLCSRRWVLAYLCFFGYFFMYTTRVNMSVAIICMVRSATPNFTQGSDVNMTTPSMDEVQGGCESMDMETSSVSKNRGEFDWDKPSRSRILAMYFYGYIIMQIPGGWLAGRYGGTRVWGIAIFFCGLFTALTPVAARTNIIYLVYALRFLIGLAAGVTFPTVQSIWGRWAPPLERSKLMTFSMAGPALGTIAAFSLSGFLCDQGFDNGWGSIFYVFGGGSLLWVVFWFWFAADAPGDSSRISRTELKYIELAIGYKTNEDVTSTPWGAIFKSKAVWALIVAHVCHNWTNYTLLTGLPTFMKEVLDFDIKQNGGLSSLPYLCACVVSIMSGQVADCIRSRTRFSTATVRKAFTAIALLTVAIFLLGASFVTCDRRHIAVLFLCISVSGTGIIRAGFSINHVDIAPRHAGVLFGITNTAATIPGMLAPLVAGALTPNKTAEEWRNVFFVCAAFAVTGAIFFAIFAEGEVQSWARKDGDKPETNFEASYQPMYSPKAKHLHIQDKADKTVEF